MKNKSCLKALAFAGVLLAASYSSRCAAEEPYKFYEQLTESMRADLKQNILSQVKVIPRDKAAELIGTLMWTWKRDLLKLEDPKSYLEKSGSQNIDADMETLKQEDKKTLRKNFELARLSYDTFVEFYKFTDDEIAKSYEAYVRKGNLAKW